MLLGWAWFVYLAIRHDYGSNYTVWLTPFILLMFVIKPPDLKAVYWAVDVLIVSMLLISIISHLLHVLDIYPFPNFIYPQRLPQFIQEAGILPLLGLEYRWPGPFVSVSDAGPVGALLFSLGWLRHGLMRWIAIVGGVAILLAAFSFNGIFAALGGALVVFLFSQSPRLGSLSVYSRVSLASVALVGSLIFVTSTNSTLNGRTEIWIDYLRVWDRFPQFGTGPSYIVNRPEVFSHDHAHNFYIDTLIKHGWIAFLLAISALLCVGVLTVKATKLGIAGALGVWTTIMLLLVAETLIAWRYMGSYLFVLLLIAALSNGAAALTTRPDTVRN
jgi:O-antigen ligase